MRINSKLILLIALLMLVTGTLMAQTVKFTLDKTNLKPGDKGILRATLTIPAGQKQSFNPKEPEYFYLEAQHPDLKFGRRMAVSPTGYA